MEHTNKLKDLHKAAEEKLNDYIKTKEPLKEEHKEKIHAAKKEWSKAWNKLMETLLVIEHLEI
jgi:hypothetical protein